MASHLHSARPVDCRRRVISRLGAFLFAAVLPALFASPAASGEPLPIEDLDRTAPVDFATEILPILKANCLACHHAQDAAADLTLESPQSLLRGGAGGPAVVPGKSGDSLLLKVAAHRQEPAMPPAGNDVGARTLTPRELALIRLWIDQGAAGSAPGQRTIAWQPPPASYQPIFAVSVSSDGLWAACGRGNRLALYHLPTRQFIAELIDPAGSPGAADQEAIRSLAFSPDGRWLASGGFQSVKLWRAPKFERLAHWAEDNETTALALSPDGKWSVAGSKQGRLQIRDLAAQKTVASLDAHQQEIRALAFSANGAAFYSASLDRTVRGWNVDGTPLFTLQTPAEVHALLLLEESHQLITGEGDQTIRIWKLDENSAAVGATEPLRELKGHTAAVTALALGPAAGEIVSGGADGVVRFWNLESGRELAAVQHGGPVTALAVSPDGKRIASAGSDHLVKLWDAETRKSLGQFQGDPRLDAEVARLEAALAFTKSEIDLIKRDIKMYAGPERRVTTTAEALKKAEEELAKAEKQLAEKTAALEKVKGDEKKAQAAEKARADAETARDVARTVVERAQVVAERAVATLAETQAAVAANEVRYKELEQQRSAAQEVAAQAARPIRCLVFSPEGKRLIVGGDDHLLHLLDANTASPLQTVESHGSAVIALARGGDGYVASAESEGSVSLWNVDDDWTLDRVLGGEQDSAAFADRVLSLDFSPDGQYLAAGGGLPGRSGELTIWSPADGRLLHDLSGVHTDTVLGVRFSPDGKQLATAGADRMARVFQVADWQPLRQFPGHTAHVLAVDWHAEGKLLATSSTDQTIKLWNVESGVQVETYKGTTYRIGPYKSDVSALRFVGPSEQFLAASGDGTVRLHRLSHTDDIVVFSGASGFQYAADVSRDGRSVLAGGADGHLRLWTRQERNLQHTFPPLP